MTYFVTFNIHRGPFADARARRAVAQGIDAAGIVRRTLGRHAIPANGLIPPGLLGYVAKPRSRPQATGQVSGAHTVSRETTEVTAIVNPILFGEFSAFTKELMQAFREMGYSIRVVNKTMAEFVEAQHKAPSDLMIGRWIADYPDADTFTQGVLHSREGTNGRYGGIPAIDALAERGRGEIDPRTRESIYREIEDIIAREALLIPLFHEQVYRFARPEVEGLAGRLLASRSSCTRTSRSGAQVFFDSSGLGRRVPLRFVPAVVLAGVRAADLRLRDDPVPPQAPEILEGLPAPGRVLVEERGHSVLQRPDHVRADRVVEHRRRAHLHRAAAEEEVVEGVREVGDPADTRERLVRKRVRERRHLREGERQDPAGPPSPPEDV